MPIERRTVVAGEGLLDHPDDNDTWTVRELRERLRLLDETIRLHGEGEISNGRFREILRMWIRGGLSWRLP